MSRALVVVVVVAAVVLTVAALLVVRHGGRPPATTTTTTAPSMDADDADPSDALLKDLEQQETALLASTDWATFPASDGTLGPDPVDPSKTASVPYNAVNSMLPVIKISGLDNSSSPPKPLILSSSLVKDPLKYCGKLL